MHAMIKVELLLLLLFAPLLLLFALAKLHLLVRVQECLLPHLHAHHAVFVVSLAV